MVAYTVSFFLKYIKGLIRFRLPLLDSLFTLNEDKEKLYLNTSAALLQQSINEMTIFTKKLKGKKEKISVYRAL